MGRTRGNDGLRHGRLQAVRLLRLRHGLLLVGLLDGSAVGLRLLAVHAGMLLVGLLRLPGSNERELHGTAAVGLLLLLLLLLLVTRLLRL